MTSPVQNYAVSGEPWRVEQFDLLTAEFDGLVPADLPTWHTVLCGHERPWLIVRRLYGVRPVIPPANVRSDDLRTWNRPELEAALGVTRKQLQAELDGARGLWLQRGAPQREQARAVEELAGKVKADQRAAFTGELPLVATAEAADRVISEAGFNLGWFTLEERAPEANLEEKLWFARQLGGMAKLFAREQTRELARRVILMELKLRRRDDVLFGGGTLADKGKTDRKEWIAALAADEGEYQKMVDQLRELAPWYYAMGNAVNAKGSFAEIIRGFQEWFAQGDTTWLAAVAEMADLTIGLPDGFLDAEELQALNRPNTEQPEPQYRLGLAVYAHMVKANIFNPAWKPPGDFKVFGAMDAGYREGFVAYAKREGLEPVALLRDGPEGEHPPLIPNPAVPPPQPN